MSKHVTGFFFTLLVFASLNGGDTLYLRDNLKRSQKGDYIVTNQSKTYSMLYVQEKNPHSISIQEINIPSNKISLEGFSWSQWLAQEAPGNSSRVLYNIDLQSAQIQSAFCLTRNGWREMNIQDHFLSTLLNLKMELIPLQKRRRVGSMGLPNLNDKRPAWQPKVYFNGHVVPGVILDAWQANWPKDGSELSGKTIEAYLPQSGSDYLSYFPYWLQVNGVIGNAKIRIVDSGKADRK